MKICAIIDNRVFFENFTEMIKGRNEEYDFYCSLNNHDILERYGKKYGIRGISLKEKDEEFYGQYDLFLSRTWQIFPNELVKNHRCINLHPGFNPYNRGIFPHHFSIINKLPVGVTIHEMDEQLDHGAIIAQKQVEIYEYDTAYDLCKRIQKTEIELLREWFDRIVNHQYTTTVMESEGNYNSRADFNSMCEIDMDKTVTMRDAIDYLRAMSFHGCDNAFFIGENGERIYVELSLKREDKFKTDNTEKLK